MDAWVLPQRGRKPLGAQRLESTSGLPADGQALDTFLKTDEGYAAGKPAVQGSRGLDTFLPQPMVQPAAPAAVQPLGSGLMVLPHSYVTTAGPRSVPGFAGHC